MRRRDPGITHEITCCTGEDRSVKKYDGMTPERLQEIRELLKAATPGPWDDAEYWVEEQQSGGRLVVATCNIVDCERAQKDAKLIAAAPTIIQELADEVERLQRENERLTGPVIISSHWDGCDELDDVPKHMPCAMRRYKRERDEARRAAVFAWYEAGSVRGFVSSEEYADNSPDSVDDGEWTRLFSLIEKWRKAMKE